MEVRDGLLTYIKEIKDNHNRAKTRKRTTKGDSKHFVTEIRLHQRSILRLSLFILEMDELMLYIQDEVPQCISFASNILLIDETCNEVNARLEV